MNPNFPPRKDKVLLVSDLEKLARLHIFPHKVPYPCRVEENMYVCMYVFIGATCGFSL